MLEFAGILSRDCLRTNGHRSVHTAARLLAAESNVDEPETTESDYHSIIKDSERGTGKH